MLPTLYGMVQLLSIMVATGLFMAAGHSICVACKRKR